MLYDIKALNENLVACETCGHLKHAKDADCAICELYEAQLEREMKRWIAWQYQAKKHPR
jgi:recombinational DNA repair protein RecR